MTNLSDITSADIRQPADVARWEGDANTGKLVLLDQTMLPSTLEYFVCKDVKDVYEAIYRLVVRGAPAIGVAAGYGLLQACQPFNNPATFLADMQQAADYLDSSRPTAVNLGWALRRMADLAKKAAAENPSPAAIRQKMLAEARAIHAEDEQLCFNIGRHAAPIIMHHSGVLTHCNAGALATGGIGTATAGMYIAHRLGHKFRVFCDETRPLLQGARLTAWELQHGGIDACVITDNMAAQVMKEGRVGMVIVGADRIAANGDAANKIGTYQVAIGAKYHNIPFYVAAPYSTFDLKLASGAGIPIEQRASAEITNGFGRQTAPDNIATYSPAFDVTPAELITGIITERGVISPVNAANVKKHFE